MLQGLQIAEQLNSKTDIFEIMSTIGEAYWPTEIEKSLHYCEKALNIAREMGDEGLKAKALCNIGAANYMRKKYTIALGQFEEALSLSRRTGDRHMEGIVLFNVGDTLDKLGKKQKGLKFAEGGIALLKQTGAKEISDLKHQMASW